MLIRSKIAALFQGWSKACSRVLYRHHQIWNLRSKYLLWRYTWKESEICFSVRDPHSHPANNDNLPVHEDKLKGVYVKGLLEVFVGSVQDVYDVMRKGLSSRSVGSTSMNSESSRSHSIFMIYITQKSISTGSTKTGKLYRKLHPSLLIFSC